MFLTAPKSHLREGKREGPLDLAAVGVFFTAGQRGWPVGIGTANKTWDVLGPLALHTVAQIQVQLAIFYVPGIWVHRLGEVVRYRKGTVAAVLR